MLICNGLGILSLCFPHYILHFIFNGSALLRKV